MSAKLLAIDIGSSKMKFVVGKAGKNKVTVKKMFYASTPSDAVNNGEILDIKLMREALTVAVKNNGLSGKNTVVTIQSSTFISREFTIPKLKDETEVVSALRFEVEQFMPIDLDEYTLSCRELEKLKGENGKESVKYMVGLMPRRIVDSYYDLLKSAGLNPVAMDVNSNSIEKFLNYSISASKGGKKDGVLLVADIGNDAMDMTVFEKGFPRINRTVPIGGSEVTRNLANTFGLDYSEAEFKKINDVDISEEPNAYSETRSVGEVAKDVVEDWAQQLGRMNEFYMSRTKGKGVDGIYIYGGSSGLKGLNGYLGKIFGLDVHVLSLPHNVRVKANSPVPAHYFLNAIGAIIRR